MILKMLLTLIGLLTLVGSFGYIDWRFDMASHFRVQYLILSLLLLLWFAKHKRIWFSMFTACFLLINAIYIAPFVWVSSPALKIETKSRHLRIFHYNLFNHNKRFDDVFHFIEETSPDLISLQEMNSNWRKAFQQSRICKLYPYQLINVRTQTAFLSRIAPQELIIVSQKRETGYLNSAIKAVFKFGNQPLTVLLGHTYTPATETNFEKQKTYYKWLAQIADQPGAVIVIGDLNTTPWSSNYRFLKAKNVLKSANELIGLRPTWPIFFPPMLIPLDHVLVNRNVVIINHQLGPFLGSDHLPLITDIRIHLPKY